MATNLVIVESPAKAKTINKILGHDYVVKSSMGHIRDLPVKVLGVDIEKNFAPKYVVVEGRKKVVAELKKAVQGCDTVYLAPDPDREGEAIAWHLKALLTDKKEPRRFVRVQYNEITPAAVRKAFANPGEIDMHRVDAQQARRVLDRIVGYKVSPILWRRVKRGLSAGRVQSVALRLVCERENEIRAFKPEEYWILGARVRKQADPQDPFRIKLVHVQGEKADVKDRATADRIRADLDGRALRVANVATKEVTRRAPPPYITSSLQQAGSGAFGFSPKRTMSVAQKLYEGVDLGDGPVGLITYMRTDSFAVSQEALQGVRGMIGKEFGAEFVPEQPNFFKSRESAQGAHEAIRPTDVSRKPEEMERHLNPDEMKLYRLIWRRFIASQMAPARMHQRTVKVDAVPPTPEAARYLFHATASEVVFPGYMKVGGMDVKPKDGPESAEEEESQFLPPLTEGEALDCLEWLEERKETQPPPRYSEASLVKALEANGVGRPSTYAQTIATLEQRQYVTLEKRALVPTQIGEQVIQLLVSTLETLFNVKFTASMEELLDEIEEGKVEWTQMLAGFYRQFAAWMEAVKEPAADRGVVDPILTFLEKVKTWAPAIKNGKRTYSDERFVTSVRAQAAEGVKPITVRQLEALLRVALRYREQIPEIEEFVRSAGHEQLINSPGVRPPVASTFRKLDALQGIDLHDSARQFVDSLKGRVDGGRSLTEAQLQALDRIVVSNAGQIVDYDKNKEGYELAVPDPVEDLESAPLLAAMKNVTIWKPAVTRGRRIFDDEKFYQSLSQQFERKRGLSDKQRGALKKMVKRYKDQVPGYEALAEQYGLDVKRS